MHPAFPDGRAVLVEILRFATTGSINAVFTVVLYQILIDYINPESAYAIAWITGFVFIAAAYPTYVFRTGSSFQQTGLLAMLYLGSFVLGLILIHLAFLWGVYDRIAIFAVIAVTSSVNYLVSRRLFRQKVQSAI